MVSVLSLAPFGRILFEVPLSLSLTFELGDIVSLFDFALSTLFPPDVVYLLAFALTIGLDSFISNYYISPLTVIVEGF